MWQLSQRVAVRIGNPAGITDVDSLCGKSLAVMRGTFQEKEFGEQKAKCQKQGSDLDVRPLHQSHGRVMFNRPPAHEIPDSPTILEAISINEALL